MSADSRFNLAGERLLVAESCHRKAPRPGPQPVVRIPEKDLRCRSFNQFDAVARTTSSQGAGVEKRSRAIKEHLASGAPSTAYILATARESRSCFSAVLRAACPERRAASIKVRSSKSRCATLPPIAKEALRTGRSRSTARA